MGKGRLEAFSDGVIAVIITIMVLELHAPEGGGIEDLAHLLPKFLTYVLSFIYVGIYWVNHHHFYHVVHKVSGGLLWANLHLLFWLSLVPFSTAWVGEHHFETWPVAAYGINLLACSIAWAIMLWATVRLHGRDSEIAHAMGNDLKGKISTAIYVIAIVAAFFQPVISLACYTAVALIWLVPDKRVERVLGRSS